MHHSTQALGAGRMSGEAQQKDRNFIQPASPDTPVEKALTFLQSSIEGLHASVSSLEVRLSAVLSPTVPTNGIAAAPTFHGSSPLSNNLSDLLQAQHRLDARISDLISRIEL